MIRKFFKKMRAALQDMRRAAANVRALVGRLAAIEESCGESIAAYKRFPLFRDVKVIELHEINEKAKNIVDVGYIINTMFYEKLNLILFTYQFPLCAVEQGIREEFGEEMQLTEDIVEIFLQPLYYKCADIWEYDFQDGTVLYKVEN